MSRAPRAAEVAILVGTRPEIVKMSPVLREFRRRNISVDLIHSGQHYDDAMATRFFRDLGLEEPLLRLRGRESSPDPMQEQLEPLLARGGYRALLVHGDTNTAIAGAQAAARVGVPVAHVEAGLRCGDERMVEERNRVRIDQLARWLFVPTGLQLENLRRERLLAPPRRAVVVGNTIVDALAWMLPRIGRELKGAGFGQRPILLTVHRAENAKRQILERLLPRVGRLAEELDAELVWPIHPRMRAILPEDLPASLRLVDALGWRDFLALLQRARIVLTDSGGVQEEAMVLRRPCVTLRPSTERPETLVLGANCLVDLTSRVDSLQLAARRMLGARIADHPWGDGRAAARILDVLAEDLGLEDRARVAPVAREAAPS